MPRVKPKIKKIEDKRARQRTFCQRRDGLFKKASELSIMCEAQVGVVVISETKEVKYLENPKGVIKTIRRWQALRQDNNEAPNEPHLDINFEEEDRLFDEYLKIREGLGNFAMEKLQLFKELLQKMDNLLKEKEREKEVSEEKMTELQNTLVVENVVHEERAVSKLVMMPNANCEVTPDLNLRLD